MSTGLVSPGYCELDEETLQELYAWIDEIPLSRPKKNIARDFSDGVLVAEIIHHFLPKLVELHNYTSANSLATKTTNWNTLNRKVLKTLNCTLPEGVLKNIASAQVGVIEPVLSRIREQIDKYIAKKKAQEVQNMRPRQKTYDYFPQEGRDLMENNAANVYTDDYYGPEAINYSSYAFNTGPLPIERYATGPPQSEVPVGGYHPGAPPGQPLAKQGEVVALPPNLGEDPRKQTRPKVPAYTDSKSKINLSGKGKTQRASSYQDVSHVDQTNFRFLAEEKEQALLASQETIQILQSKVRRLEHLLHLKDLRISDLTARLQGVAQPPRLLPPQQNPPQPPGHGNSQGLHPALMKPTPPHQQPLPPLHHPSMPQQEAQQ